MLSTSIILREKFCFDVVDLIENFLIFIEAVEEHEKFVCKVLDWHKDLKNTIFKGNKNYMYCEHFVKYNQFHPVMNEYDASRIYDHLPLDTKRWWRENIEQKKNWKYFFCLNRFINSSNILLHDVCEAFERRPYFDSLDDFSLKSL